MTSFMRGIGSQVGVGLRGPATRSFGQGPVGTIAAAAPDYVTHATADDSSTPEGALLLDGAALVLDDTYLILS